MTLPSTCGSVRSRPGRRRALVCCAGGDKLATSARYEQNGAGPAGFVSLPPVRF